MNTFMFPGQGSQSKGMGGKLFDEFPELTKKADKILGYSIKELCLEDPRRELNKTQFTQPALYVVNALSFYKKIEETGKKPDFVIGHSLGEFNALLAAECFDFSAGLKLVKKRGELMSQATDGGMAAIMNATKEEIESILKKNNLNNIDLANFNTLTQTVISGSIEEIGNAQFCFQEGEVLYYPLNTSGAFHSRFMQPSKEKFLTYLTRFKLNKPKIPIISNVTAKPYKNNELKKNLSDQIASAVRWCESVQYLLEKGTGEMDFQEIGHGEVLTKLVAKIKLETAASLNAPSPATSSATSNAKSNEKSDSKQKAKLNEGVEDKETSQLQSNKIESSAGKLSNQEQPIKVDRDKVENSLKSFSNAEDKVNYWNVTFPIGTKVESTIADYDNLETRTEAVVLFGHRAAVYMKEYNGYFDLDELTPL